MFPQFEVVIESFLRSVKRPEVLRYSPFTGKHFALCVASRKVHLAFFYNVYKLKGEYSPKQLQLYRIAKPYKPPFALSIYFKASLKVQFPEQDGSVFFASNFKNFCMFELYVAAVCFEMVPLRSMSY